jgi:UDP-GlcNAc:undecaprenyl-phosphate/decaprenyl-phosphate GlcNAc-1-phosphate transferase
MPFVGALVVSLVLTPLAAKLGSLVGIVDRPGDDLKIHSAPVPVLGGPAVVVATLAIAAAVGPGYPAAIAIGVLVALAAGLLDDLRPMPPWSRVVLLAVAGAVLVAGGLRLDPLGIFAGVAMVLVTVACANATNLLDGQDGLVGGLGLIAALGLAPLAAGGGTSSDATLGLALAGALAGFLVFNRPPARIYLGNGGAYAVGALLAVLSALVVARSGWEGVLTSGICLGVFVFELVLTTMRRIRSRRPMATCDRQHAYDLVAERIGRTRSTLVFWGAAIVAAGLALLADALGTAGAAAVAVVVAGAAAVVWLRWSGRAHLRRVR